MALSRKAASLLVCAGVVVLAMLAGLNHSLRSSAEATMGQSSESAIQTDRVTDVKTACADCGTFAEKLADAVAWDQSGKTAADLDTAAGLQISAEAVDEFQKLYKGFFSEGGIDKADAWSDFVEALKVYAASDGDTNFEEEEAQAMLRAMKAFAGGADDDTLDDDERNAWQTSGWLKIDEAAVDEFAALHKGFFSVEGIDKTDAWDDFGNALKAFAGDGDLSEAEAQAMLERMKEFDPDSNGLDDGERNKWQSSGWKA